MSEEQVHDEDLAPTEEESEDVSGGHTSRAVSADHTGDAAIFDSKKPAAMRHAQKVNPWKG